MAVTIKFRMIGVLEIVSRDKLEIHLVYLKGAVQIIFLYTYLVTICYALKYQ